MCIRLVGGVITRTICVAQSDLKSLIAYSSIGHIGILARGLLRRRRFGVLGGVVMMIAHGLCSSGMFYLANIYYLNSNSRSVLMNKGILFVFPFVTIFRFLIFSCNISAPPSINLAGELVLRISILSFCYISAVPISLITFLAGVYSIYLYVLSCHGSLSKSCGRWKEIKNYDFLILLLHFIPMWGLVVNLKVLI